MLEQEIPMKWVAVIFSALGACMVVGPWMYFNTLSAHEQLAQDFANCVKSDSKIKTPCKAATWGKHFGLRTLGTAACASHASSKIEKCAPVPDPEHPKSFKKTVIGTTTDVTILTYLTYRDDWNNVHPAYYTVRLTRASKDDLDWHVANTEFSVR